jgi:hypothetical protein
VSRPSESLGTVRLTRAGSLRSAMRVILALDWYRLVDDGLTIRGQHWNFIRHSRENCRLRRGACG